MARLTREEREPMKRAHRLYRGPGIPTAGVCEECQWSWPCDVRRLLDTADALEEEVDLLKGERRAVEDERLRQGGAGVETPRFIEVLANQRDAEKARADRYKHVLTNLRFYMVGEVTGGVDLMGVAAQWRDRLEAAEARAEAAERALAEQKHENDLLAAGPPWEVMASRKRLSEENERLIAECDARQAAVARLVGAVETCLYIPQQVKDALAAVRAAFTLEGST
jgi:hypothetical protein